MTDEFDPLTGELLPKSSKTKIVQSPAQLPLTDEQLQDKVYLRNLAIRELAAIVKGNCGDVKGTNACNALLDRVDGKPSQSIELTGKDGAPLSIRLIEAQQRLLKDITSQIEVIEHITAIALDDII